MDETKKNGRKDKFLAVYEGFYTISHHLQVRSRCRGRELLATDVEGIESVRAVGAVFEEVFF